jgi:hypothetical protein
MEMNTALLRTITFVTFILMFLLFVSSITFAADSDGDGVENPNDNCAQKANGPILGTCTAGDTVGVTCTIPGNNTSECGTGGFCSMNQEDVDFDNVGDACDYCDGPGGYDIDGDEFCDGEDSCPESKLESTVILVDCDTGVYNTLFDDGCTMTDMIYNCAEMENDYDAYMDCVSIITQAWKNSRTITGKEKGAIKTCAVESGLVEDICLEGSVQKTGQTTSYATGDDGDLQKGTALPKPRFTDNLDGTITDNLTELIWLKDANCFGLKLWGEALLDSNKLADGQCGLTDGSNVGDWRLPNRRELFSLIHDGYNNPAISNTAGIGQWSEGDPFINVLSNFYWSSTSHGFARYAWVVSILDGFMDALNKSNYSYIWPIRGGQ